MISVIMPAYNAGRYIRQAILSALQQTTEEAIEVLVTNDCSTDDTRQIVLGLQQELSEEALPVRRLFLIDNETNLGVAESRNKAIREAKGEYIAFLDADDWWEVTKLSRQLELFALQDTVLTFTARELMDDEGQSLHKVIDIASEASYERILRGNVITFSSVLMKTSVAREFPFEQSHLAEDYMMLLKVLKKYGTAYGLTEPLTKNRQSDGGKSRNKLHAAKMHYGALRAVGISRHKAVVLFVSYAFRGVKKYFLS